MTSWNLILKINWSEVLAVNAPLKLLGDPITSRFGYVFHIIQFARNVDLVLTILLKYSCPWIPFLSSLICKNLNVISNLWHSCEIYLTVHYGSHEVDFWDRVPNEKKKLRIKFNVVCNSSWDISSKNFVKHIFVKIILNKNKVPSSF